MVVIYRTADEKIQALEEFQASADRVLVLVGPRNSGKTSTVHAVFGNPVRNAIFAGHLTPTALRDSGIYTENQLAHEKLIFELTIGTNDTNLMVSQRLLNFVHWFPNYRLARFDYGTQPQETLTIQIRPHHNHENVWNFQVPGVSHTISIPVPSYVRRIEFVNENGVHTHSTNLP